METSPSQALLWQIFLKINHKIYMEVCWSRAEWSHLTWEGAGRSGRGMLNHNILCSRFDQTPWFFIMVCICGVGGTFLFVLQQRELADQQRGPQQACLQEKCALWGGGLMEKTSLFLQLSCGDRQNVRLPWRAILNGSVINRTTERGSTTHYSSRS